MRYVTGTLPTDIGYTGQRLDTSTGLMYYRARYYAQGLGRFISADTIVPDGKNPQAFNRYAYTTNNPLRFIDPTGHMMCDYSCYGTGGGAGGGGGAGIGEAVLYVYSILLSPLTVIAEPIDTVAGAAQCAGGDGWACAGAALPFLSVPAAKGLGKVLGLIDDVPTGAMDDAVESLADGGKAVENTAKQLDELPDDTVLYQYANVDPNTGKRFFPDTPRTKRGETGLSCQIADLCGQDPVKGFQNAFGRPPDSDDLVRETTVGNVRAWGGWVDPDGTLLNPAHGTIYSTGGKWGNKFDRMWGNKRIMLDME